MTTNTKTQLAEAAESEMRAAHAIVADPNCDARLAAPHLLRAWQCLAASRAEGNLPAADEDRETSMNETLLVFVPEPHRKRVQAQLAAFARERDSLPWETGDHRLPSVFTPRDVLHHMAVLRDVLEAQRGPSTKPERRKKARLWTRRVVLFGTAVISLFLVAVRPWQLIGVGAWRGAYYPSEDFRGEPTIRRDKDIDFNWGLEPPIDDIPSDRFGVRWDSCLVLDDDESVAFQVVSDDGARLYVDGDLVIDNWGNHKPEAKGTRMHLSAGAHHVELEYFEASHTAAVHLMASFDEEEPPASIPSRMLSYPRGELDAETPCQTT